MLRRAVALSRGAAWAAFPVLLWLGVMPVAATQQIMLAWERSPDDAVTGYRLYRGIGLVPVFDVIDIGNSNVCALADLSEGQSYQFFVTAYDGDGVESDPSNTLRFAVPLPPVKTSFSRNLQGQLAMRLQADALPGKQIILQTTTNLTTWIPVITSGSGAGVDMTVMVSPSQPQRYFRTKLAE